MYVGTQIRPRDDGDYKVWAQLGVRHVCVDPPGDPHHWSLDDLCRHITPEEVALMWRTAPPRMPLDPKEELRRLGLTN
jgi:hypothetical protein